MRLGKGREHGCMDAGGRATQEAEAVPAHSQFRFDIAY